MKKLVVTRHRALYDYLIENGFVEEGTECLSHASVEDVVGKHVFGILPYWLASKAAMFTEVQMRIPLDKRGKELTIKDVRFFAVKPRTYEVREVKTYEREHTLPHTERER